MPQGHLLLEGQLLKWTEDVAEDADGLEEEAEEEPAEDRAVQDYQEDPAVQHHVEC